MKMRQLAKILLVFLSFILVYSCKKTSEEEQMNDNRYVPTPLDIRTPVGFPPPIYPDWNPSTVEGVRLGRMLFYDDILSSNGLSCSSCHPQSEAFTVPFHINPAGDTVSVPPVINLAWNPDFLWNGGAQLMEHVPLADFGPEFFNSNMDTVVNRLKAHSLYPRYFKEAFNVNDVGALSVTELQQTIANSLIQFIRTIISDNSKFDKVSRHETAFTAEEMHGANIFYTEQGDCFHCHGTPLFTNNTFNNTGMDTVFSGLNFGRYLYTGLATDMGKFSAPTLRNIELTAPYMHDARFKTLEEVMEFYNSGVHWNSPNIDPIMTKPFKEYGLMLTSMDKADLIAFLKTLTDTTLLTDPTVSDPF